jgi:hypothetical protein
VDKLDTDYGTFKDLISVSKIYTVPLYQRRYSWGSQTQVAELWTDVVRIYRERRRGGGEATTHFVGSVVVGETENKALGPGACNIIDGQQRLTTFSLIVAAIRDTLLEDPAAKDDVSTDYLCFPKTGDLRLVLSQGDAPEFDAIVNGEGAIDPKSLIRQAYNYVCRELQNGFQVDSDPDVPGDDQSDLAEDSSDTSGVSFTGQDHLPPTSNPLSDIEPFNWELLLSVIATDLELVFISGVPSARAYQIFATLNHGGLKLDQVDLIRNAVFMKLPEMNQEAYQKIWRPLENLLGTRALERFLHAWVIRRGHDVPKKDTYSSVLEELKVPTEVEVYDLLVALRDDAYVFSLVDDPESYDTKKLAKDWSVPEPILSSLSFLANWGTIPAQPLVMDVMVRWRAKDMSSAKALKLLKAIESFVVRRYVAQIPPHDLRSTLARLTLKVSGSAYTDYEGRFLEGLAEPGRRWPSDAEFEDAIVTRPFYRAKNVRQAFLVLQKLAAEIEGKEAPQIQQGNGSSKYSIEHILPQTVEGTNWLDYMTDRGDGNAHMTWNSRRHTIGNLTLTAYNSEMSNNSFEFKKNWISENAYLKLSTAIVGEEAWTRREIEARSEALGIVAKKIWSRPV